MISPYCQVSIAYSGPSPRPHGATLREGGGGGGGWRGAMGDSGKPGAFLEPPPPQSLQPQSEIYHPSQFIMEDLSSFGFHVLGAGVKAFSFLM